MSATGQQRRPVRRHLHREEAAGLMLLAVIVPIAAAALAGQLAAVLDGHGWPSWRELGANKLVAPLRAFGDPTDPMGRWPGLDPTLGVPPAWLFWLLLTLLLGGLLALVLLVWRRVRRRRPGFASRAEVAGKLGERALLAQAARLRPQLARTTTRLRPEQLGSHLGRDVNTGINCYSSIRQSTYVLGPSESGKTSCVVIPEALDHDGPLLAPSSRADVMAAAWKSRSRRGPVLLFDPLQDAPALPLLYWDPVRACADTAVAMRRAQALMAGVDMRGVSNGDTWKNRGQSVLRNLLHAAAISHQDIRTVLRWAYDQTSTEPAAVLSAHPATPDGWADMHHQVTMLPERQRAGYYMAVESAMACFEHPKVLRSCLPGPGQQFDAESVFDPSAGQATVFLLAQREQAVAVTDLLGALMDEVITVARARGQRAENNRLDPPLKFLVDEATNTATLTQLPSLISDGGGRGIPTTMVVQERAQAVERWGQNNATAMWGAATIRMVLPGVAGHNELREIAAYADEYDEETPTRHYSAHGHSEQFSLRTRPGLTAGEVRALPPQHALVLAAGGLRPVMTRLTPYFQRPDAALSAEAEREFYAALNEGRSAL
jgi:type IV secretion system protein VirD4